jgi:hypothetical protein
MNVNWEKDKDKELFAQACLKDFVDFWDIETKNQQLKLVLLRNHTHRQTK